MICKHCARAGDLNRGRFETGGGDRDMFPHPENCGCPCMHKMPKQWEKMFSTKRTYLGLVTIGDREYPAYAIENKEK